MRWRVQLCKHTAFLREKRGLDESIHARRRACRTFSAAAQEKLEQKASCRMPIKLNQASVRTSMHIDLPAPRGQDTRKDTRSTLHAFDQPGNDARGDERLRTARDEAPTYAARRRVSLPRPPALDQP